ncbi:hypothetical protein [Elioraea tepidiphila]|jgi:hypothetical protein|uniref:hypothetical protein n=1 Tax=Elioraea tepidiphila TaxID=457934 RepID=UPI00035D121A|nr:hypothetical protein [Elioraea tepidiphila]
MSRISTMLTVCTLLAGTAPALAERDLGLHPIRSAIDLSWTTREGSASGHWIGTYAMRGVLDDTEKDSEALLAGWGFRCEGVMSGSGSRIEAETGTCRFEGEAANRFAAEFAASPGPWTRTVLRIRVHDGSGAYRTLRGEGTIERRMLLPFDLPVGWGYLTGAIAWHRD